jgi:hypothetical protein
MGLFRPVAGQVYFTWKIYLESKSNSEEEKFHGNFCVSLFVEIGVKMLALKHQAHLTQRCKLTS